MADTKTFKDIDKSLKKLVDETKENFKITEKWQKTLDDHATALAEKVEKGKAPRAKVQKEMLRALETSQAQDKVYARDAILADFKMGNATLNQLKAASLTKDDLMKAGFSNLGANFEMIKQVAGKFTQSVKGYWEYLKKNSEVLIAVRAFYNSKAVKAIKSFGGHIAGILDSGLREVLGEFAPIFDTFKKFIGAIWTGITGALTGMFDHVRERMKERREKKMVDHLQKIKDGIGYLVKGDKLDAISGGTKKKKGMLGKIMDMLGFGKISGIGAIGAALLLGLKLFGQAGIIAALGKMIYDGIMGAIEGWKKDGIAGASKGYLIGITSLPRKIAAWIAGLFGADKLQTGLSDEGFSKFIDDMNLGIEKFMADTVEWFAKTWVDLADNFKLWMNDIIDWIPDVLLPADLKSKMKATPTGSEKLTEELTKQRYENDNLMNSIINSPAATQSGRNYDIEKAISGYERQAELRKQIIRQGGKVSDIMGDDIRKNLQKLVELQEKNNASTIANTQVNNIPMISPGAGRVVPETDKQLGVNNWGLGNYGNYSDRRLKENIKGI